MKILVLQLKRIGDLILTTPALSALREAQPGAEITLVHDHKCAGLLGAMPFVDRSMSLGNGDLSFWPRLMANSYDVCVDFTGNDRSALIAFLSKATRRLAFRWVQRAMFRPLFYNEFVDSNVLDHHTSDHYLHLLEPLGVQERQRPIHLEVPEASRIKARALAPKTGFVIVHPGSARAEKYWPAERWAAVVDFCQGQGLQCVITGGTDTYEQQQIAALKAALKGGAPLDLSGQLDLLGFAGLIQEAKLLLSVDSAAMHLGAGFGVPQIALFGKTNPYHWRPRHSKAVVISAAGTGDFKPRMAGAPMNEISTQSITAAITALL